LNSPHDIDVEQTARPAAVSRRRHHRLLEPPILFPAITVLVVAVVWGITANIIYRERAAARRDAAALAAELANTYEAQVIRALREIDHSLVHVGHELEDKTAPAVLRELESVGLLLPPRVFTTSVLAPDGSLIASTAAAGSARRPSPQAIAMARQRAGIVVGPPRREPDTGEWQLDFSRRTEAGGDSGRRIVAISVPARHFVSVYEGHVHGERGVLALIGSDGLVRVRRTGGTLAAGGRVDYQALLSAGAGDQPAAALSVNEWDGVRRYTVARELFEFPLAIVLGLAEAEQLAPAARRARVYVARAGLASVALALILALLGRLSWQLQQERTRAMQERVQHAQRVEHLAYHDSLTGLPNRAFFSRLLDQEMQQARRYEHHLALLFLDLDRFKAINDSLGHEAGDELLQEIARRLRAVVRDSDIIARLGGDEFVLLLPEIAEGKQVAPVAEKILEAVSRPFVLAQQEFRITVSIGIALFPDDGEDEQTLTKHADIAMYHAKAQGKNDFKFYSERLNADTLERLALESSLRGALDKGELRLFYQGKHEMHSGRVTGTEALLRWEHPELGLISPMKFIPLAEENGLIVPIGRWVLNEACRQNVAWQNEGLPAMVMAVNFSARQFLHDGLIQDIKRALEASGMVPELLEIEITESMIMRDMTRTLEILAELKQMGIRVAIDDFGTGYSALAKLKSFPLDTIKIDGSFIHDLARSSSGRGLTEAIIAMGKNLSLTVVAEGVESFEQAQFLRTHGCDEFQGFYMNEPAPAETLAQQLRALPPEPISGS